MLRRALVLLSCAVLTSSGCSSDPPPRAEPARVSPAVWQRLAAQPSARVMVAFAPASSEDDRRSHAAATASRVLAAIEPSEFRPRVSFEMVAAVAGEVTLAGLEALRMHPDVVAVSLDPGARAALVESVPLIGADQVQLAGYEGAGVTVAVLDSGIQADHPDLAAVPIAAEHCVCDDGLGGGCCPDSSTEQDGAGSAADDHGHGTAVTAVIASQGVLAARGVAPAVEVVSVKVLDSGGYASSSSQVIAGLDWIAANRPDVDVVNMSLGSFATFEGVCDAAEAWTTAYGQAIDALRASGVPVFVSSGNDGLATEIAAPACIDGAIAVGAVHDEALGAVSYSPVCDDATSVPDSVPCFSNASTALDVLAPGALITTSELQATTYTSWGTSFASPHAAGVAALLLGIDPGLSPTALESILKTSGVSVLDARNGLTFPRVDALAAALSAGAVPCGDGVIQLGEDCDDGNTQSGDGCSGACFEEQGFHCRGEPSVCSSECGDGEPAADEECDDGNLESGDGCSESCTAEEIETTSSAGGSGEGGAGGSAEVRPTFTGEGLARCRENCCCTAAGGGERGRLPLWLALALALAARRRRL